jgi:hypothetical protein
MHPFKTLILRFEAVLYLQKQQEAQWTAKALAGEREGPAPRHPLGVLGASDLNARQVVYRPVREFFLG